MKTILIIIAGYCMFAVNVFAGTTVIHVETETGGNIDAGPINDGVYENVNGAVFWNGTGWSINDTYGHMYFLSLETGQKLKDFTTTSIAYAGGGDNVNLGYVSGPGDTLYNTIHNTYNYSKDYNGTTYSFLTAWFTVQLVNESTLQPTGPRVDLVSRSANATSNTPYFDVFIQNEDGSIEAIRSDPRWYSYSGIGYEEAIAMTDSGAFLKGYLDSPNDQYWFDMDGGSEMGGKTYHFDTGGLTDAELLGLSSTFVSDFSVQYTDLESGLREIELYPYVYSIAVADSDGSPGAVPLPAPIILLGTGLIGLAGFRKKPSYI